VEGKSIILSDLSSMEGEATISNANIAFDFPPQFVLEEISLCGLTRYNAPEC
jgi:hypothetical protein